MPAHERLAQITYREPNGLKPRSANARTHSRKQVEQIAQSISSFGFNNPVLVDEDGCIIAGHGRVEAAKLLGFSEVPTVSIEHLSDDQKRAYVIADNRLAELAGWDREILSIEIENLMDAEIDFEITDIGFETAELDLILHRENRDPKPDPADEVLPKAGLSIAKPGDLWLVGSHRVYCGDALAGVSYEALLGSERAAMVFADPPYNIPIDGFVCGLGKNRHQDFAMACGEMSEAEFTRFLTSVFRHLSTWSADGSIHFVCMDWRHLMELLRAGRIAYSELKNLCVWAKDKGGMGSLYRSQHEFVAVFKNGTAAHVNNIELGRFGRTRTNVWSYPGLNGLGAGRADRANHPTVKPVALVADAILDCSRRKDIVLDPFLGSGTTIIAAERVGRRCYSIELDPAYVDLALRRVREATGIEPLHSQTRLPFSEYSPREVTCDGQ